MVSPYKKRSNGRGAVGAALQSELEAQRKRRSLSQRALSRHLNDQGTPLSPSQLAKIELGERTVSVDDLVALALVLKVSPIRLLLPDTAAADDEITIGSGHTQPAFVVWGWAQGTGPWPTLSEEEGFNSDEDLADWVAQYPTWLQVEMTDRHPLLVAAAAAAGRARRVHHHVGGGMTTGLSTTLRAAREAAERLKDKLDEVEADALAVDEAGASRRDRRPGGGGPG